MPQRTSCGLSENALHTFLARVFKEEGMLLGLRGKPKQHHLLMDTLTKKMCKAFLDSPQDVRIHRLSTSPMLLYWGCKPANAASLHLMA